MNFQDWLKGSVRYQRLKEEANQQLQGESIVKLFIGVQGKTGFWFALNPLSAFRREVVVALTDKDVVVLRIKRPAIFGSKVTGIWYRTPRSAVKWIGKEIAVGNEEFTPFPFHRKDAEELVQLARA